MAVEQPEIAGAAYSRPRRRRDRIGRIVFGIFGVQPLNAQIDFAHFKAGGLELEIEVEQR